MAGDFHCTPGLRAGGYALFRVPFGVHVEPFGAVTRHARHHAARLPEIGPYLYRLELIEHELRTPHGRPVLDTRAQLSREFQRLPDPRGPGGPAVDTVTPGARSPGFYTVAGRRWRRRPPVPSTPAHNHGGMPCSLRP